MKTHLNLATTDLEKTIAFYSTLLDAPPAKSLEDYALFFTDEPGLELAIDLRESVTPTLDSHFGIVVEDAAAVDRAIARLEAAGLATEVEREETCCYANQTKVWAVDPEGRRWEVYTVHEETVERNDSDTACCTNESGERSCCAA